MPEIYGDSLQEKVARLRNKLKNKTVAVLLHGSSLYELEQRIDEFKDFDICWASMGQWDMVEKHILSKIDKNLDITFDTAEVEKPVRFEIKRRIPRLKEFLERPVDNFHITMRHASMHLLRFKLGCHLETQYKEKIIYAEDICPANVFCVSFPLFITSLWACGASNIILFGCDGRSNLISDYFHPEEVIIEKQIADNVSYTVTGDSGWVAGGFPNVMKDFERTSGIPIPTILNCSTNSIHTLWPKITYDEAIQKLKEYQK